MKAETELNLKQSIYLPIKYFFCFIASLKRKELRDLLNAQLAQRFNLKKTQKPKQTNKKSKNTTSAKEDKMKVCIHASLT